MIGAFQSSAEAGELDPFRLARLLRTAWKWHWSLDFNMKFRQITCWL
jgi:hypothetical protein